MPAVSKRAVQVQQHMKSKSSSKRMALATPTPIPARSALGAAGRVCSSDSVFFDSNISSSHISSASGSAGCCSFGSDHPDSLVLSESAGRDRDGGVHESSLCNPDVDQSRSSTQRKPDDVHGKKQEYVQESTEEEEGTKPANVTFSPALKARQNRRLDKNSDPVPPKKHDRRRPASLDLNYPVIDAASSSSPRFPAMKKASGNPRRPSGTFPSPGTPNYGGGVGGGGLHKGWSSERVPLPASSGRRYAHCAPLPLNNGRSLPSKWEDAEKWIFSPVSGEGGGRASAAPPHHRRPKSKSGPLGAPGYAYYALSSPLPVYDGGRVGGFMPSSPFSAGVLGVDAVGAGQGLCRGGNGVVGHYVGAAEPCIARSASVHGWSEVATQASVPGSQEENGDGTRDAATMIPPVVTRRDMATQMSPEGSAQSSPKEKPCESSVSSIPPIAELPAQSSSSKLEVRDVEVDDCITLSQWSMNSNSSGGIDKGLTSLGEWRKKAVEDRASAWDITETSKSVSKFRREEAKITAWENLQKANAEAEIRKLEMKLEKIRTSSMNKIMNKLRSAQRKAQEMRGKATASEASKVTKTSDKILSFRKGGQIGSLSGCFTCHAFYNGSVNQ